MGFFSRKEETKSKRLSVVPCKAYNELNIPQYGNAHKLNIMYNVAAWLHIPDNRELQGIEAFLVLKYHDARGEHTVEVDSGFINEEEKLLLTGRPNLSVHKKITKMELHLQGIDNKTTILIDHLWVKPSDAPAMRNPQTGQRQSTTYTVSKMQ